MKNHLVLESDGQVDLLTGLDAPEIFYRFLRKAIARAERESTQDRNHEGNSPLALVRFRLVSAGGGTLLSRFLALEERNEELDHDEEIILEINSLAFLVAKVGTLLSELIRADENLTRLGETTFLLVAHIGTDGDLSGLLRRFEVSVSQLDLQWRGHLITVEIAGFIYQQGESLLDLLERAEV